MSKLCLAVTLLLSICLQTFSQSTPKPKPDQESKTPVELLAEDLSTPERILAQRMKTYIKQQRPNRFMSENGTVQRHAPIVVEINIFVNSFSSVSVVDMDYTIDLLLRQRWIDPRLRLGNKYTFSKLPISYMKDLIWIPDLFFRNAKRGQLHTMTTPNYLIWVNTKGVITFSQKISMTLSCPMDLWTFPMDTQVCKVNMGSYGYARKDMDFFWWVNEEYSPEGNSSLVSTNHAKSVTINKDLQLNEFDLKDFRPEYCKMEYKTTGEFACLEAKFILQRKFGFYLIYAYCPSLLIVMIAWMSFFIDHTAVPARISIGLLCVLALMTQTAATLTQLPRVSYAKAIDLWLFICLAFVVISLLEFAIVNSLSRSKETINQNNDSDNFQKENNILMPPSLTTDKPIIITTPDAILKIINAYTTAISVEPNQVDYQNPSIFSLLPKPIQDDNSQKNTEEQCKLDSFKEHTTEMDCLLNSGNTNFSQVNRNDHAKGQKNQLSDAGVVTNLEAVGSDITTELGLTDLKMTECRNRHVTNEFGGRNNKKASLKGQKQLQDGKTSYQSAKARRSNWQKRWYRITSSQMDHVFALLFPLMFALFNVCYWGYFLFWTNENKVKQRYNV